MAYTVRFQGCTHPPGQAREAEQLVRASLEGRIGGPQAVEQLCRQVAAITADHAGSAAPVGDADTRAVEDWQAAVAAAEERLDELWDMRDKPCSDQVGGRIVVEATG